MIKEQRSDLVKHHLWVLWTDYFKPPHFEKYPQLNQLFNEATKLRAARAAPRAAPTWPPPTSCCAKIDEISQDLLGDQAGLTSASMQPAGARTTVSVAASRSYLGAARSAPVQERQPRSARRAVHALTVSCRQERSRLHTARRIRHLGRSQS